MHQFARQRTSLFFSFSLIALSLLHSSCSSIKNVEYFKDIPNPITQPVEKDVAVFIDPVIKPNDLVQVSIQTLEGNNMMGATETSINTPGLVSPGSAATGGYLVDKNGTIELPLAGKMKVQGLTTSEARDLIRQKVSVFYKDPVVNVRLANFTISVLGQVMRPGTYIINNEKASILDAIGLAGDLELYGKRENILLIREVNGKKQFARFNLNSSDLFKSPYFYLQQGDIIYVEPNKAMTARNDVYAIQRYTMWIGISSSLLSLVFLLSNRK